MMLREGYTTGTCATVAVMAGLHFWAKNEVTKQVTITVPAGKILTIDTNFIRGNQENVCFSVMKDSGDDPDCTNGCIVLAEITKLGYEGEINFVAGKGVGTVTKEGLKIPPNEPAINPVPRQMIIQAIRSHEPWQAIRVTLSIQNGEIIAQKTMNERLGIMGGLSILGTSGIVRPMSTQALVDTIRTEIDVRLKENSQLFFVFGAMGEDALHRAGYSKVSMVQVSNYIGDALDYIADKPISSLIIAGHTGKIVKLAGGIFYTHSHYADARMDILCAHAGILGVDTILLQQLFQATTTVAADKLLQQYGYREKVWQSIANTAKKRVEQRVNIDTKMVLLDETGSIFLTSEERKGVT